VRPSSSQRIKESVVTTTAINNWKELASRECDGLVVSLLWNRASDRVKVAVADTRLDEDFEFRVAGADALAAYYHPFAYAPPPGFGPLEVERESPYLRQQA
jgi:hypothetical protein